MIRRKAASYRLVLRVCQYCTALFAQLLVSNHHNEFNICCLLKHISEKAIHRSELQKFLDQNIWSLALALKLVNERRGRSSTRDCKLHAPSTDTKLCVIRLDLPLTWRSPSLIVRSRSRRLTMVVQVKLRHHTHERMLPDLTITHGRHTVQQLSTGRLSATAKLKR